MKNVRDKQKRGGKGQRGAAAVEFGLIAMVFFTLLLGIIEFGRFLYLWNTVQEVTRHAAREAVVRNFTPAQIDAVQRAAIFQPGTSGAVGLPGGGEVTNSTVSIEYLNAAGNVASPLPSGPADNIAACLDAARTASCIRFVEASINGVQYVPMIGLFPFLAIDIPASTVVMPAESLGYAP